jgi:hypothetical protein
MASVTSMPATGDSVYDRCYGWREDAESLNNTLDRTLYGGRMIAYIAARQLTVMLGFALDRNAIAAYRHRRRQSQLNYPRTPRTPRKPGLSDKRRI